VTVRRLPAARSSRTRWILRSVPLVTVLLAAGAFVVATRLSPLPPDTTPVSLSDALEDYRAHPGPLRDDVGGPGQLPLAPSDEIDGFTVPDPGVYTYATTGKDWVEYAGDSVERSFPATTYATVRHAGGCVWELYFTPIEEHVDAHRQCSTPGEYLCMAHMQTVSFAGIEAAETHRCEPDMLQVGGEASRPGGVEETVCRAEDNQARVVIRYVERDVVDVGGLRRDAHHVRIDSYVTGEDIDGTAVADVWFDAETGLYLRLLRTADINVEQSGEQGTYRLDATYELTSLTPRR
jgi:hypothetical protein